MQQRIMLIFRRIYLHQVFCMVVFVMASITTSSVYGQSSGSISGKVVDADGASLPMASVMIQSLKMGAVCNEDGIFKLTDIKPGTYQVSAVIVGYKKQTREVTISEGKDVKLNFTLEEDVQGLEVVTVTGQKNDLQRVREQAYAVTSIDVAPLQNLNMDVNMVLNRSTGIRIRQEGGLGSDFSFSLNGFSGNQVRFFVDGISSDFLGASMQFNNIPVNIIERIEVYKGVVPIHLGSDALGGAVNIITSGNTRDFLDVSYSYGSFNTHQAAISSRVTFKDHFVVNASGFFNYSDNNFEVDAQLVDKNTGKISDVKPYKLFNEDYRSAAVMVEGGVVRTKWADRFLVGLIASGNKKHYQRGRAMVLNPAGEVYRTDETITPTLKYNKRDLFVENLSLNFAAVYSNAQTMSVDTSSRIYSWDGSYVMREFGSTSGELSWYKTRFRFNDRTTFNTATLEYALGKHTFTFNNTYSYFWRKGSDPLASQYDANVAFSEPNTLIKNITGVSYKISLFDNTWRTTFFAKVFNMKSSVRMQDESTQAYQNTTNKKVEHGLGIASSLLLTDHLHLKTSYEHTARLPENYELFGDGLLVQPNMLLVPEQSHNMNLGVLYQKRVTSAKSILVEGGLIYRLPKNMIRPKAMGVLSVHENLASARVMGAEASFRYDYKQKFNVEVNATYQDMRNYNKTINTYPDPLYLDRIPNIPYLFGNVILGYNSREFGESKSRISAMWATMYVEEFYLNWPSQGSADTKYVIPRQLSHDVSVSLSSFEGKYNISLSCWNLADSKLYDNFKVQKPGRSFSVKLRYNITGKFRD